MTGRWAVRWLGMVAISLASAMHAYAQQRGVDGPLQSGRAVPPPTAGRPEFGPRWQIRFDNDHVKLRQNAGGRGVTPTLDYWATAMRLKEDVPVTVELCEAGPETLVKIDGVWQCVGDSSRVYLSDTWTVYVSAQNHENLSAMTAVIGSRPKGPPPPGVYLIMWKVDGMPNVWSTPFTVSQ
jgi:hypothetical protein